MFRQYRVAVSYSVVTLSNTEKILLPVTEAVIRAGDAPHSHVPSAQGDASLKQDTMCCTRILTHTRIFNFSLMTLSTGFA